MITTMITTIYAGPHLPPVVCEPWCKDGSGHTDAHFPGDQWCTSEDEARVPLTREKLVEVESDQWELDYLAVYASREREGRPYVNLHRGEGLGVQMTPEEALELGEALIRFGRMAR